MRSAVSGIFAAMAAHSWDCPLGRGHVGSPTWQPWGTWTCHVVAGFPQSGHPKGTRRKRPDFSRSSFGSHTVLLLPHSLGCKWDRGQPKFIEGRTSPPHLDRGEAIMAMFPTRVLGKKNSSYYLIQNNKRCFNQIPARVEAIIQKDHVCDHVLPHNLKEKTDKS